MSDNVKARELHSDGNYTYVPHSEPAIDAQETFFDNAYAAVGTKTEE